MAVTTTPQKVSINIVLNNGENSYVYTSLGQINNAAFDAAKVLAIVTLLEPCLAKTVDHVEKLELSTIEESA